MWAAMRATARPRLGIAALDLVVAAAPVGIGHDRLPTDLVEGDVLSGVAGGAGDRHGGEDGLRIGRRPLQRLHGAHGAAGDAEQLLDAEMVDEQLLRPHHVADGDDREAEAVGLAGARIDLLGSGRTHAAAEHVGADHEIAVSIEGQAGPDRHLPPAGLAGHRMDFGRELVAREGMAEQDGVRALAVQRAVGLVGNRERADFDPGIEPHRPLGAEDGALPRQVRAGSRTSRQGGHRRRSVATSFR
jgi:hypothetical protein